MNYEKEYNKLVGKIKKAHLYAQTDSTRAVLEDIYPQLSESEDERIRKKMIEHFKSKTKDTWCNMPVKSILAWLEKQKDLTTENIYKHSRERMSFWNGQQKEQKPAEWSEEDEKKLARVIWYVEKGCSMIFQKSDELVFWLKSLPLNLKKKNEDVAKLCSNEWSVEDEDRIRQIERIAQQAGCTQKLQEEIHDWLKSIRKQAKPEWSEDIIQKAVKEVGLTQYQIDWFKTNVFPPKQEWSEEEKQKLNRIYSIIGWAMDEHAFSSCKKLIGDKEGVELQDFLRSIAKPKQEWSEQDRHAIENCEYAIKETFKDEQNPHRIGTLDWLKSIRPQKLDASKLENFDPVDVLNRIKTEWPMAWEKAVGKQEWDEFDEDCLKRAIWYVENPAPSVVKDTNLALWLKSLPERKNLPPKQEWNKEDERMLKWIEDILLIADGDLSDKLNGRVSPITDSAYSSMKLCIAKCRSWLKSLKPSWKPSEEQMKAMSYFVRKHQATANRATTKWPEFEAFKSLYNDLKKRM